MDGDPLVGLLVLWFALLYLLVRSDVIAHELGRIFQRQSVGLTVILVALSNSNVAKRPFVSNWQRYVGFGFVLDCVVLCCPSCWLDTITDSVLF